MDIEVQIIKMFQNDIINCLNSAVHSIISAGFPKMDESNPESLTAQQNVSTAPAKPYFNNVVSPLT